MKKSMLEVAHELAKGLYNANVIDIETMHTFDAMCLLSPVHKLSPFEIKRLRLKEKISRPVFAEYLNTGPSTIKQWETGEKHPTGTALKLLNIIEKKGLKVLL